MSAGLPLSAGQFSQVYIDLGIATNNLGCIMLDTADIEVSDVIPHSAYYTSESDGKSYVRGNVAEDTPHVTLLYGLLRSGPELQKHVDAVLDGWEIKQLTIKEVSFFYSPDPDENFITIVALLEVTPELAEANARLRFLPHIDTFPEYKPHITLAYVDAVADWQGYVEALNEKYAGTTIDPVALNYGH